MQQLVLPLPTAPMIMVPVNSPRSGMMSQLGFSAGMGKRGLWISPEPNSTCSVFPEQDKVAELAAFRRDEAAT